ncbi:MAG: putative protein ninG [Prokaryotic dsDNA virus sp.]|nr:MAG: putative protein ninG [Prokaryotic dsDNA virus sp.]|tara:strand:+ start:22076 stop:22468 length:393 start_codon:yes stop_codon:yes gene_type:complete
MSRKPSRKNLIKKLDNTFSQWIRLRYNKNEIAECVTCGKKDHWKKLQAGHFVGRKHYSTRWDQINVQVQCMGCNVFRYGEQYKFGLFINRTYGDGTTDELFKKSREIVKYMDEEIKDMINYYSELVEELK